MTFGQWLARARFDARLTQTQLAERCGLSVSYISALEREEPNARDGSPRRPRVEKVKKIAKALGVNQDDALKQAGYFPQSFEEQKKNIESFIKCLEDYGIEGFHAFDDLSEFTDEQFEKLKHDVRTVTLLNLAGDKPFEWIAGKARIDDEDVEEAAHETADTASTQPDQLRTFTRKRSAK